MPLGGLSIFRFGKKSFYSQVSDFYSQVSDYPFFGVVYSQVSDYPFFGVGIAV